MPWNISDRNSRAGSIFGAGGFATSSAIGVPGSVLRAPAPIHPLLPSYPSTPTAGPSRYEDRLDLTLADGRMYPDSLYGEEDLDLLPQDKHDMAVFGGERNGEFHWHMFHSIFTFVYSRTSRRSDDK